MSAQEEANGLQTKITAQNRALAAESRELAVAREALKSSQAVLSAEARAELAFEAETLKRAQASLAIEQNAAAALRGQLLSSQARDGQIIPSCDFPPSPPPHQPTHPPTHPHTPTPPPPTTLV